VERILLLVDDEENILRSLNRLLRRDGYQILTASSGDEGLELLKEHNVGVILSDQRMPGMSGVEFLSQVKNTYPDNVRMVLSGYTDLQSVTDAINEGAIYKFLTKPWDDELLRTNVRKAFEHYEMAHENERLTEELRKVNAELEEANQKLASDNKQQSRVIDINKKSLHTAQEVLENLPVGVLGIAEDGMIAVHNHIAQDILSPFGQVFVGNAIDTTLPKSLSEGYKKFLQTQDTIRYPVKLENGADLIVWMTPVHIESETQGNILMLLPMEGSYEEGS
jgi:response regulator RpfG family c-di-GMP phosphodiesterase